MDWARHNWQIWRSQYPSLVPSIAETIAWLRSLGSSLLQRTIGLTGAIAALAAEAVATLVITFFFLKDGRQLLDQILSLCSPQVQRRTSPPPGAGGGPPTADRTAHSPTPSSSATSP